MAMTNVVAKIEGTSLILTIDLTKEFGLSASGKSNQVASTGGNVTLKVTKADMETLKAAGIKSPEDIRLGLNVYKKVAGATEQSA